MTDLVSDGPVIGPARRRVLADEVADEVARNKTPDQRRNIFYFSLFLFLPLFFSVLKIDVKTHKQREFILLFLLRTFVSSCLIRREDSQTTSDYSSFSSSFFSSLLCTFVFNQMGKSEGLLFW